MISWMSAEMFADSYLVGRAKRTFPTYKSAWRKMWTHGREIRKCVWSWNDMEMAGHLILLNDNFCTENMVKQSCAVMSCLKEVFGMELLTGSAVLHNVKKGILKEARKRDSLKGRREKSVMSLQHVRLLIGTLYKQPAERVKPADRRFLVMQLLMFFGIRRFDDIRMIRVRDCVVLDTGDLEMYVSSSKTDQLGVGFMFHVSGERYKGFSVPDVLDWYVNSVGLKNDDYLFLRFRFEKGLVVAQPATCIGYSAVATQLKDWCINNDIPVLTLHSGRRGGVTLAVECGIDRMNIQNIGHWSSDAVDEYFQPKRAGVRFTRKAIRRL